MVKPSAIMSIVSHSEALADLAAELVSAGLSVKGVPIIDGKIRRVQDLGQKIKAMIAVSTSPMKSSIVLY